MKRPQLSSDAWLLFTAVWMVIGMLTVVFHGPVAYIVTAAWFAGLSLWNAAKQESSKR